MSSSRSQQSSKKEESEDGIGIVGGIFCAVLGAAAGAIGYHYLTKGNPLQEQKQDYRYSSTTFNKDDNCAICLESMAQTRLPCGHLFHKDCADKNPVKKCPICRASFN